MRNQIRGKLLLSRKNIVTSEGAVAHNGLYYQPLPITRHQVGFYAKQNLSYHQLSTVRLARATLSCELHLF